MAVFTQQLRRTVRNETPVPVEFFEEYLDFDRFPGRTSQLTTYFSEKYSGLRIDAIVAVGSVALRFATEQLRPLLPRIPIVFALTVDNIINIDSLPPNVTGRFSPLSFGAILTMARGLQPDARRVVIIGGLSAIDSFAVASAQRGSGAGPKPRRYSTPWPRVRLAARATSAFAAAKHRAPCVLQARWTRSALHPRRNRCDDIEGIGSATLRLLADVDWRRNRRWRGDSSR